MPTSLRSLLGYTFLAAVAAATLYWSQLETVGIQDTLETRAVPLGYYLSGAVLIATDESGQVRYRIAAERAEELPEENELVLSDVRIEYDPAAGIPWRISATEAQGPLDRSYFDLRGEVRIRSEAGNGTAPVLIETTRLRLEPDAFVASSDAIVTISMNGQRLRSSGLRAYLMEDRLELESEVHGQIRR